MNKIRKMLSIILELSITLISTCPVLAAETQKSEINLSSAKEAKILRIVLRAEHA